MTTRLYLMQIADGGPMKIGVARDVSKRRAALARSFPIRIDVLFEGPGSFGIERDLHRRFADRRLNGEWFRPGDEIVPAVRAASDAFAMAEADKAAGGRFTQESFVENARDLIAVIAWPRPVKDRAPEMMRDAAAVSGLPLSRVRSYWHRKVRRPHAHEVGILAVAARRLSDQPSRPSDAPMISGEMRYYADLISETAP